MCTTTMCDSNIRSSAAGQGGKSRLTRCLWGQARQLTILFCPISALFERKNADLSPIVSTYTPVGRLLFPINEEKNQRPHRPAMAVRALK